MCKQWFESDDDWTEEEKSAEAKANGFGADLVRGECMTVCDDCYREAMSRWGCFKESKNG
jgi:hypothetical protein